MKTLKEYADRIQSATPGQLSDLLVEMVHDFGEVSDGLIPVERAKMEFWLEHKKLESDKPVSDKTLDMMWMGAPGEVNGMIERRMDMYKKALVSMMSAVKAILRNKEMEARNSL